MANISYIDLNDNKLGSESCRFLIRANWPKLKSMKLSTFLLIYVLTNWELGECSSL